MKSLLLALLFAISSQLASAHEMRPSIASLSVDSQGILTLDLVTNLEAWLAEINPSLSDTNDSPNAEQYDRYRQLDPDALTALADDASGGLADAIHIRSGQETVAMTLSGVEVLPVDDPELPRDTKLQFVGGLPDGADHLVYRVDDRFPNTAVRLFLTKADPRVQFVKTGASSDPLSLDQRVERSVLGLIGEYIELGFTHIIPRGLDHIIFILGLTLISKRFIDLVIQVTAFTVAHSVTLAMGLYGVLNLPASIV
jgi:hypothetical protein